MPKDTFLNLHEEKRDFIEEAALDEFSEHGYEASSINRIVDAARIAKGSFYQYFEDKGDLFKHILAIIGDKKLETISPVLMNPAEHAFFTLLEEIYRSGLAFTKDHPRMARIGFEVYENRFNPKFQEIMQESQRLGYAFYEPIIDTAITRGEIDPNIDKHFTIHMLMKMQIASIDYYLENYKQGRWTGDIMPVIQNMIHFIKNGIQHQ